MSDPYGNNPGGNPYGNPSGGNPYGQNPPPPPPQQPYGQPGQPQPYGQPPAQPPTQPGGSPYGPPPGSYGGGGNGGFGGGYGGGYSGGSDPLPTKTDGLSIAAFVLSFLCLLAPIGVILGFVGLGRTKGGRRKGRGLAIGAIVIGLITSIASVAALIGILVFADSAVTPGNAEVGQCVDVDEDDDTVFLWERECSEEHDAEIVGVTEVTSENRSDIEEAMAGYCATSIAADDLAKLGPYLNDIKALIEDPAKVSVGDHIVCYVEPDDELTKPLL